MQTGQIEDVSDTAFMVAAYRAIESKRTDALFRDPLATKLAGSYGEEIVRHRPRWSLLGQWLVAIRTRIIDEFIETAIAQENYVPEEAQKLKRPAPLPFRWRCRLMSFITGRRPQRAFQKSTACVLLRPSKKAQ